jgi:hypothetical protein
MAQQLQPGLKLVDDAGSLPAQPATDSFFAYPQSSNVNYGVRPNAFLYGTAPAMFGKGAPSRYIETDDQLRPQSTKTFNKKFAEPYRQQLHPLMNVECKLPLRTIDFEPASSRAELQNNLFDQRYQTRK